jgi:hypothetical protein
MSGTFQILGLGAPTGVPGSDGLTFDPGAFANAKLHDAFLTSREHGGVVMSRGADGNLLLWATDEGVYFYGELRGFAPMQRLIADNRIGCSIACKPASQNGLFVCRVEDVVEITLMDRKGLVGPKPMHRETWCRPFDKAPADVQGEARARIATANEIAARYAPKAAPKPARQPATAPRGAPRFIDGSGVPAGMVARVQAARYRGLTPELLKDLHRQGCIIDRSVMAGIGGPQRHPPGRGR